MLHLAALLLLSPPRLTAHEGAPPAPIHGGAPVEPGAWPEVVAFDYPGGLCTGTLVSDRVVLTAAHCLEGDLAPALIHVRRGHDATLPTAPVHAVERYGRHPDYCGRDPVKCKVDIHDYGYLLLADPVPDVAPARPLARQEEWDEAMRIGAMVGLVGYGEDEKGLTGIKREVQASIVAFSGTGLEFQAGGMGKDTCYGDSGGPAFVTLATGETLLAGVTSRGTTECGGGGSYGISYAALCWLNQETGLDLRPDACAACDCLVIDPDARDEGCDCDARGPAGALALVALLLRPRRRRSARARIDTPPACATIRG